MSEGQELPTSMLMLRRAAERVPEVMERQRATDPAIAAFEARLVPLAAAFIAAQTNARSASHGQTERTARSLAAAAALHKRCSVWLVSLSRDLPGFDSSAYLASASVPSDVISHTTDLLQYLATRADTGTLPSYVIQLVDEITPLIETARAERAEQQRDLAASSKLDVDVRTRARELYDELVAFLRVLRNVLGAAHHDVQQLRLDPIKRKSKKEIAAEQAALAAKKAVPVAVVTPSAPTTAERRALGIA